MTTPRTRARQPLTVSPWRRHIDRRDPSEVEWRGRVGDYALVVHKSRVREDAHYWRADRPSGGLLDTDSRPNFLSGYAACASDARRDAEKAAKRAMVGF